MSADPERCEMRGCENPGFGRIAVDLTVRGEIKIGLCRRCLEDCLRGSLELLWIQQQQETTEPPIYFGRRNSEPSGESKGGE